MFGDQGSGNAVRREGRGGLNPNPHPRTGRPGSACDPVTRQPGSGRDPMTRQPFGFLPWVQPDTLSNPGANISLPPGQLSRSPLAVPPDCCGGGRSLSGTIAADAGCSLIRSAPVEPPVGRCLPPASTDSSRNPDRGGRPFSETPEESQAASNRRPWGSYTRGRTAEGERERVTIKRWPGWAERPLWLPIAQDPWS